MPASQNFVLAKGKNTSTVLTKKRFVKLDTVDTTGETVKQCDTAGERAFGVCLFSVSAAELAKNKGASVMTMGRAIVEAGAALAIGVEVTTDTSGRAVAATSGQYILGVVDEPASGAGAECGVHLTVVAHAKV
jgi:hypothetical protein